MFARVGNSSPGQLLSSLAVVVVLLLGVVACGAPPATGLPSSGATTGDGSARMLADRLVAANVPCANIGPRTPSSFVADAVFCSAGDDDVIIRTFRSTEDRDRFMQASGDILNLASAADDAPPQLVGPTWLVTTDTESTAQAIRAVLGGELR